MGAIQNAVNSALGATSKVAIAKGIGDAVINTGAEKLANDTMEEVNSVVDKMRQLRKEADTGKTTNIEGHELRVFNNEKLQEGQKLYDELRENLERKGLSEDMINHSIGSAFSKGRSFEAKSREALKKSAKELYLKQHNTNSWKAGVNAIFNRLTGGGKE